MCTARSFLTSRLPLEVSRFIFTFRLPLLPLRFPSLPRNNPTLRKLKPCPLPPHRTSSVSDIICQRRGSSRFCPHPPVTLFNIFSRPAPCWRCRSLLPLAAVNLSLLLHIPTPSTLTVRRFHLFRVGCYLLFPLLPSLLSIHSYSSLP